MDHSLRGYLERRSTDELDAILNYLVNNYVYDTEEAVKTVLAVLQEREKDIKREITPEIRNLWESYLKNLEKQQKRQDM